MPNEEQLEKDNFDLEEQIVELKQRIQDLESQLDAVTLPSLGM